jgi:hypothetical protein
MLRLTPKKKELIAKINELGVYKGVPRYLHMCSMKQLQEYYKKIKNGEDAEI